jgi:flagellar protein FlaJ
VIEVKKDETILVASAAVFVALTFLAVFFVLMLGFSITIASNMIFAGILILTVPYSLYKFFQFKKVKNYEKEFPSFLRDLAESQRAGLTLLQSLQAASKSEYGLLSAEVRKMDKQLSWNVPLEKVLKGFSDRMSASKLIVRSLMVVDQATKSGGNVEETMEALADNIEALKDVQEEKSVLLNQQVLMMYAIFFIFMGITIALIKFLVPLLQSEGLSGGLGVIGASNNPCSICINNPEPACFGCSAFFTVSTVFDFGPPEDPSAYYKSLFLLMIIIQGVFSGLIAGQISADSVTAGVRHSLLMLFAGFAIFLFVVKLGLV